MGFGYDAENRMLTANKTAGGTVAASYAYDPLGRRTHKSGTGVTERAFLNDGDDAVLDYDGNNKPVAFTVPGPAIDEPIVMSTPNGDGTGSTITAITAPATMPPTPRRGLLHGVTPFERCGDRSTTITLSRACQ